MKKIITLIFFVFSFICRGDREYIEPTSILGTDQDGESVSRGVDYIKASSNALFVHRLSLDYSGYFNHIDSKRYEDRFLKKKAFHQRVIDERGEDVFTFIEAAGIRDYVLVKIDDESLQTEITGEVKELKK